MTATVYIDRAQLEDRITDTDLAQRLAVPSGEAKLAAALADANSAMDLYIGSRNSLPLASVPASLTALAATLAIYRFAESTGGATKAEADAHTAALAVLDRIAAGTIRLGASQELTTGPAGPRITSQPRRMTRAGLEGLL